MFYAMDHSTGILFSPINVCIECQCSYVGVFASILALGGQLETRLRRLNRNEKKIKKFVGGSVAPNGKGCVW